MEATGTPKVTCHRTGDVSVDGEKIGHVSREVVRRGRRYEVQWVVTDLGGNYVTSQHHKRLAVQAAVAHARYTARS